MFKYQIQKLHCVPSLSKISFNLTSKKRQRTPGKDCIIILSGGASIAGVTLCVQFYSLPKGTCHFMPRPGSHQCQTLCATAATTTTELAEITIAAAEHTHTYTQGCSFVFGGVSPGGSVCVCYLRGSQIGMHRKKNFKKKKSLGVRFESASFAFGMPTLPTALRSLEENTRHKPTTLTVHRIA